MRWKMLPIPGDDKPKHRDLAIRLNALGSLYFHIKWVLQRARLIDRLHAPICASLEGDHKRFLLEFPRDHFKTTMVGEGLTTWWALPFNEADEAAMRTLGYDDAWIAWMKRAHNPHVRILTVSEIITNAVMFGQRLDRHFQDNDRFRAIFPDIIPTTDVRWSNESKIVRCNGVRAHGEGTFDYIGVGGALQSRHYDKIIEDDLVGKDAWGSETIMNSTIDYHRLLEGAFDGPDHVNYVVGNRWKPQDLNGWIRKNEDFEHIESHGALGGCCDLHPSGHPIFIEEFTRERLDRIKAKQGSYIFASQYLNLPIDPEDVKFKLEWLRFYKPTPAPPMVGIKRMPYWLRHEVKDGETLTDLNPNVLVRSMVVDPNHGEEKGRCHHAIVVTGLDPENDRIYLLDLWAKSTSYDELINNIWRMSEMWALPEFWLETVAAQRILKYYIEYKGKMTKRNLTVRELKTDRAANAKRVRIESLEPILREGRLWVRRDQNEFLDEYELYPGSNTLDVLDCLGYATQTWNAIHARRILDMMDKRRDKWNHGRSKITGY